MNNNALLELNLTGGPAKRVLSADQLSRVRDRHEQLLREGRLPTRQQLDKEQALFRERFGPNVLAGLDGEALLNLMHDSASRDSLVNWIEYKNDEEFQSRHYGSIAGGSALKFRVFRRKETGAWQAADESNYPHDISVSDAIKYARAHRDQLLKGCELLAALSESASDEDYAELQDRMDEHAPNISRLAWGHKYFGLLFPNKLDNYHSEDLQRYILLKLLQLPPEGQGRYRCAGRFMAAARETGLPFVNLEAALTSLYGNRHRYWRIGTRSGDGKTSYWQMMQERNCVAVGWKAMPDLSWVEETKSSRDKLKELLQTTYPEHPPTTIGKDCSQLSQYIAILGEGDIVLAADGATILGIGKVTGGYEHHPEFDFPHQRKVMWLRQDEWGPFNEGLRSTVRELGKHNENILEIERRIQEPIIVPPSLTGIPARIRSVLERKGQVILYGPPGTGKTYWAERTANDLAAITAFGKSFDALEDAQKQAVTGRGESAGLVRMCCFHPGYGYEDFLEGYRPQTIENQIAFVLRDGVFKRLCRDAADQPERSFYLIIDEINRGDIPRIFGELLTTLEKDKRGKEIILPVSQDAFFVPRNVFVIGTMNTADRSISLLDAALRRRFGFVELMPDGTVLKDSSVGGIAIRAWFEALNAKIREHVGRDARNLQIGHSYLMHTGSPLKDVASLKRAIRDDIIPLLEEYCYEDYATLVNILGEQIVDVAVQRIRHELFDDGQEVALVQALLAPFPDIATSTEAISTDESHAEVDENDEGDEP